ncbi:hypothetical protein H696_02311 [Fonticula alba]|uniref:Peptidase C14 caspase domain-containing protein n=1 Tax=Fonticula alba TaxID=691883 RepID=A0A058ZAG1_FONAL|nr:hypothetical protein H696_02311 [Fonticula alba]KCV71359.1 hypothetical protein H696_02311 [Fonticula alba]|eukprot:XP_009494482.1 hypothetical protein H696_02311 [Fonticula alba]
MGHGDSPHVPKSPPGEAGESTAPDRRSPSPVAVLSNFLGDLVNLTVLDLSGDSLDDSAFLLLMASLAALDGPPLKELYLADLGLSPQGFSNGLQLVSRQLTCPPKLSGVHSLSLSYNSVASIPASRALCSFIAMLPELQLLFLEHMDLFPWATEFLPLVLPHLPQLQELRLDGNTCTDIEVASIAYQLHGKPLSLLSLRGNPISLNPDLAPSTPLLVQYLDLSESGPLSIGHLSSYFFPGTLVHLRLVSSSLVEMPPGLRSPGFPALRILELSHVPLPSITTSLTHLLGPNLLVLDLSFCNLIPDDLARLALESRQLGNLAYLDLSSNPLVTLDALTTFFQLSFTHLRHLLVLFVDALSIPAPAVVQALLSSVLPPLLWISFQSESPLCAFPSTDAAEPHITSLLQTLMLPAHFGRNLAGLLGSALESPLAGLAPWATRLGAFLADLPRQASALVGFSMANEPGRLPHIRHLEISHPGQLRPMDPGGAPIIPPKALPGAGQPTVTSTTATSDNGVSGITDEVCTGSCSRSDEAPPVDLSTPPPVGSSPEPASVEEEGDEVGFPSPVCMWPALSETPLPAQVPALCALDAQVPAAGCAKAPAARCGRTPTAGDDRPPSPTTAAMATSRSPSMFCLPPSLEEGPPAVPPPLPGCPPAAMGLAPRSGHRKLGLCIGINEYQHFPPLGSAANDAYRIGRRFEELGWSIRYVIGLAGSSGPGAGAGAGAASTGGADGPLPPRPNADSGSATPADGGWSDTTEPIFDYLPPAAELPVDEFGRIRGGPVSTRRLRAALSCLSRTIATSPEPCIVFVFIAAHGCMNSNVTYVLGSECQFDRAYRLDPAGLMPVGFVMGCFRHDASQLTFGLSILDICQTPAPVSWPPTERGLSGGLLQGPGAGRARLMRASWPPTAPSSAGRGEAARRHFVREEGSVRLAAGGRPASPPLPAQSSPGPLSAGTRAEGLRLSQSLAAYFQRRWPEAVALPPQNMVLFYSCLPKAFSYELSKQEHSIFTVVLLEYLFQRRRCIFFVLQQVAQRVSYHSRRLCHRRAQKPCIVHACSNSFELFP